ncbi:LysM peptidoglycan-binding domain-containing protein [Luteolibacter marinus]|uniref:LysM peptidoglycan-binding domain-containing protein n=1 Tax=Luteolibacter marinus TaxID=2776705 RepID=UPI00186698A4|nr:LysM peptidoglycan-binding domain-containing protein [Luteolibacter marinus]
MSYFRHVALATAAFSFTACSAFKKGGEDYDTIDGNAYDTSNPYGVPGDASGDAVPYQSINPPADDPTYSQAAYEESQPAPYVPSAPSAPAASSTSHTVVKGDTLSGISRRYGVSATAIKQANGMNSDTVVLGKTLVIPGASGPVASAKPAAGGKSHTVVRGDTLAGISRKYGVSMDAIKKANGMKSDVVVLGTKLRIP